MLLIDRKDLESRGIECHGVSTFIFLNKCFQKGQTFANHQRETAIASCRQMLDAGLMSLIVNYQSHFTIWIETNDVPTSEPTPTASTTPQGQPREESSEPSGTSRTFLAKLNEPVDMKAVMTKLNEPIRFKSLFGKEEPSQPSER
ncbi:hypothetical protein [Acaryochloris sp. IP29b_bin.148]|uniref:hypothetical protein n=1 Tax=Acaryochloris sp. IP29b_bin.148 TaxID=2969218 RepID=UPI0026389868|nr:hypothetical protein [Acaryochloris sp. IP29b_bin.148]